jgi:integrase
VLTANPAALVKAKPEHNERTRFLSVEEESRLLTVLNQNCPQHIPAFLVSIHTGMRAGEQFQLKWCDVSLDRRQISLAVTKNGKARHIPLNAIALRALQERKRVQQDYRAKRKEKGADLGEPVYVFRDADENPQHNYRHWFNEALAEAKIKDYSWHCNRHTFASRLVMAGVDLRTVAELMGHSSIQMTMRYAHLAPQHNRAAVDRLVPVSMSNRSAKKGGESEQHGTEVVTKSVTNSKRVSGSKSESQNNSIKINSM